MQLHNLFDYNIFKSRLQYFQITITIFTTKRYLESPSRQGRAPSPDLELAPPCRPWSLPDDADGWLEPLSRVAGILDADGERLSYQWRGVGQSAASICLVRHRSSAASICPVRHRSSAASICSVWRRGSTGLMRRSSNIDDLAARRSSGLDLPRR
jgi:hypothetical protein